jgi:beta-lactamase regulating signal transducer with metallopeptidase domain
MIGWAFETLIASALLMVLVLLLRDRVAAAFGPRVAYMLWLLPLGRTLLPRLPEAARAPVSLPIDIDLSMMDLPAGPLPAGPLASAAPPLAPGALDWLASHWPMLVLAVWLGGAAVYFCWQIGLYRRFLSAALKGSALLCRTCGIAIHCGPHVGGPAAVGIVRRRILLPDDFTMRYNPAERRLVLAHEIAHHVRGDLIANGAALAFLSLHWFNPLAHRAYRAFRADQELACDATVLAHEAPELMPVYGAALVKSVHAATPAAACAIATATMLKRRLKMMAKPHRSRVRHIGGGMLAAATIVGGLALTASGSIAAPSHLPGFQMAMLRMDGAVISIDHDNGSSMRAAPAQGGTPAAQARPIRVAETRHGRSSASDMRDVSELPAPPALAIPPVPPLPALEPAPPAPPILPDFAEIRRAARAAADEGRAAGARARAESHIAAAQARAEARRAAAEARGEAGRAKAEAHAEVRAALTAARVQRTVAVAMANARVEIAASCRDARPATGPETDHQAITRLSAGCVDYDAIRAQVAAAMQNAREGIRKAHMDDAARDRAMDAMDRAMERMEAHRLD